MFTLFRIAFQLILIQMLRDICPFLKIHRSPTGWRVVGLQDGGAENLSNLKEAILIPIVLQAHSA